MSEATQANPKQLLADLIDAYAAAKMTGNETLTKLSINHLQEFLAAYEVVPVQLLQETPETEE